MEAKKINAADVMNRIQQLLDSTCTTRDQLGEFIGKNKQVFTDWKSKNAVPKTNDLYNIALYFGVPMDYLLFGETIIPDKIAAIVAMIATIPEEKQKFLLEMIVTQCKAWREETNGKDTENFH